MNFTLKRTAAPRARPPAPVGFAAAGSDDAGAPRFGACANRDGAADRSAAECLDDGCTLAEAGRFGAALQLFDEALALDEKTTDAARVHELRAQALLGLDRCFEAVVAAEAALARKPDWADAHRTRARALLNFGEVEGAAAGFRRAAACAPDDLELKDEMNAAVELEDQLREARRERMAQADAADDPDVAEVNRCKAALRCMAMDHPPMAID